MSNLASVVEKSQAEYIAEDERLFEEACATIERFQQVNGLAGTIEKIDFSHGRLPSKQVDVIVDTAEEMQAWIDTSRPFQLAVYNGSRGHPAAPPVADEEHYLLVRNGNADGVFGGAPESMGQPIPDDWILWIRYFPQGRTVLALPPSDADLFPGRTNSFTIPMRRGLKPRTSTTVPHVQVEEASPKHIREAFMDWMANAPELAKNRHIAPSDVAEPTSIALFLGTDIPNPNARSLAPFIRGNGYEAFHVHEDGGLHIALSAEDRWEVLAKNWGEVHPVARWGVNAMLLYAPRDEAELEIIKTICVGAYRYGMGEIS